MPIKTDENGIPKKLLFFETCSGDFAREMQDEFEKAQKLSSRYGVKVTLKAKMVIYPPEIIDDIEDTFGGVEYEIAPVVVPKKSRKYTTKLNKEHLIVGDGKSITHVLQEELRFEDIEDEKLTPFKAGANS
jgi:hypothetical protein